MRASKQALAAALRDDPDLTELVPPGSIHAVERATIPTLPSIEIIGVQSAAADYLVRHEMAIEVTVSHATEDAADAALDAIVQTLRGRLIQAQAHADPIANAAGETLAVELGGTRWSVSANGQRGVIRGASVECSILVSE